MNDSAAEVRAANRLLDREEKAFAENLSRVMNERNVSHNELADALGFSPRTVSLMMLQRCRPQLTTVKRMAFALGVEPDTLWPGFSTRREAQP